jgi:hypothetical protein
MGESSGDRFTGTVVSCVELVESGQSRDDVAHRPGPMCFVLVFFVD